MDLRHFLRSLVLAVAACAAGEAASAANVVALGADPTGLRESTGAFQAALDGGGRVDVPAGTYLIGRTLSLSRSGTCLSGEPGAQLTFPAGFDGSGLVAKAEPFGLTNIVLRNLALQSDKANYAPGKDGPFAFGIQLFGVSGATVEACEVSGFTFTAIGVAASRDVRILRCHTTGGRHGVSVNGHIGNPRAQGAPYGCSGVVIDACRVEQTWDTFVAIGLCARDVRVARCVCEGSAAHGIDVFNSENVTIEENRIAGWLDPNVLSNYCTQAVGIFVHCDWGISTAIPTTNIVVKNNVLERGAFPDSLRPVGINVTGTVRAAEISGNTVRGGLVGVAVSDIRDGASRTGPQGLVFSHNTLEGQRLTLRVDGESSMDVLFSDNVFTPASGGKSATHLSANVKGVRFSNNTGLRGRFAGETQP